MVLIRFAALAAALGMSVCAFGSGAFSNRRAPGFSLPDTTMKQHDPVDYRGKVLIIEFMQTHCLTCKVMTGVLEQVRAKYGAKVQVLSVAIMPDTMDNVKQYIKENNVASPILFDCGQMAASYLKITPSNPTLSFPHIFVIDPEGTIRNDYDAADANKGAVSLKTLGVEIDKLLQSPTPKKR